MYGKIWRKEREEGNYVNYNFINKKIAKYYILSWDFNKHFWYKCVVVTDAIRDNCVSSKS